MEQHKEFLAACVDFRRTADDLMGRLITQNDITPSAFYSLPDSYQLQRVERGGQVEGGWSYRFHGLACLFTNDETGQMVNAEFLYVETFGVLEMWYFQRFLATTPRWRDLAEYFPTKEAVTAMVATLAEQGMLKKVSTFQPFSTGLTAFINV